MYDAALYSEFEGWKTCTRAHGVLQVYDITIVQEEHLADRCDHDLYLLITSVTVQRTVTVHCRYMLHTI